ncbi:tyrosine-type recombinase/integrase [Mycoplasmatota bacterium zrk1]
MSNKIEMLISELIDKTGNELSLEQVREYYLLRCKHMTSAATYEFYTWHLNAIIDFLHRQKVISTSQIANKHLYAFIKNQQTKGLKNNTINKRLGTLKQALNHCVSNELLNRNPMEAFKSLAKDDVETEIVDKKVIKQLFNYFNTAQTSKLLLRQKVMILLILDTGMRRNELRNLKVSDIDLETNNIRLKFTKTNKNRTVFISEPTNDAITDYLSVWDPSTYLLEEKGEITNPNHLQNDLRKLKRKLGLPGEVNLSFHKLRHSYATYCLENGASLEFVRKTLGHHNLTITQKYLHLSTYKLQEEHMQTSPINTI